MGLQVVAATVCICLVLVVAEDPVVQTNHGAVRGKLLYMDDNEAGRVYYGIPYAAPPVGNLRFQPPEAATPWQGTKDCTQRAPACPQKPEELPNLLRPHFPMDMDVTGQSPISEDCLILDVYTPERKPGQPLPVMVWIHGGGLMWGSTWWYDGRAYAIKHNIIYVAVQYRLGALGFLTTGDEEIAGNMGFLDQVAALKWVQANIQAFGGDPSQVTLFGESAGSWLASMTMVSPTSKGLFQRVILQSGSLAFLEGYFLSREDAAARNQALAAYLGCTTDNTKEMRECLVNIELKKIIYGLPPHLAVIEHTMIIDGEHIPDDPTEMMKQGHIHKHVDVMAGACESEGGITAGFLMPDSGSKDFTSLKAEAALFPFFNASLMIPEDQVRGLIAETANFYLAGKTDGALFKGVADIVGDRLLIYPTYETAQHIQRFGEGKTYYYKFDYRGSSSVHPDFFTGEHADDLLYMFQFPDFIKQFDLINQKDWYNEQDRRVSRRMTQYWANFAKTGDPNGEGLPEWQELDEKGAHMEIGVEPMMRTNYETERMNFWRNTAAAFLNKPSPTKDEL